jgi:hypothetical protein
VLGLCSGWVRGRVSGLGWGRALCCVCALASVVVGVSACVCGVLVCLCVHCVVVCAGLVWCRCWVCCVGALGCLVCVCARFGLFRVCNGVCVGRVVGFRRLCIVCGLAWVFVRAFECVARLLCVWCGSLWCVWVRFGPWWVLLGGRCAVCCVCVCRACDLVCVWVGHVVCVWVGFRMGIGFV